MPSPLAVVEVWGHEPAGALSPEETDALGPASAPRRREYAAGRACARRALGRLGFPAVSVPRGPSREPIWPAGVFGSITHCGGYAAAVVGRAALSIGIDAECRRAVDPRMRGIVATVAEAAWIAGADGGAPEGGVPWDLVLFSAKESIYKAWFPLARAWLGFEEAEVEFDVRSATFTARLRPAEGRGGPDAPSTASGRYRVTDAHVFTAAWIAASR